MENENNGEHSMQRNVHKTLVGKHVVRLLEAMHKKRDNEMHLKATGYEGADDTEVAYNSVKITNMKVRTCLK